MWHGLVMLGVGVGTEREWELTENSSPVPLISHLYTECGSQAAVSPNAKSWDPKNLSIKHYFNHSSFLLLLDSCLNKVEEIRAISHTITICNLKPRYMNDDQLIIRIFILHIANKWSCLWVPSLEMPSSDCNQFLW